MPLESMVEKIILVVINTVKGTPLIVIITQMLLTPALVTLVLIVTLGRILLVLEAALDGGAEEDPVLVTLDRIPLVLIVTLGRILLVLEAALDGGAEEDPVLDRSLHRHRILGLI